MEQQEIEKLNEAPRKRSRLWIAVLAFIACMAALSAAVASVRGLPAGRSSAIPTQPVSEVFATETPEPTEEPTPQPTLTATEEPATPEPTQQVFAKTKIVVEGKTAAVVASREAAEELIENVRQFFERAGDIPEDSVTELITEVEFEDAGEDAEITSYDAAFGLLTGNRTPLRFQSTAARFEDEPIPHKDSVKNDPSLPAGTRIVKLYGRDGIRRRSYSTIYINGRKMRESVSETHNILDPVNGEIIVGTKEFGDDFVLGPDFGSNPIAAFSLDFSAPAKGDILAFFGPGSGSFHHGVDIGVPAGTEVRAACGGTVVSVMERGAYGLLVEIEHGYSVSTRYSRLSNVTVGIGDRVNEGDVIGFVTEDDTVTHLHFELRISGTAYNPLKVVSVDDIIG